uniref:Extensin-like n=1 Tax=Globodera pallida TaxID=36090 RepID=A0A183C2M3_GLOPA
MTEQYQSTSDHNQSLVRIQWALSDESDDGDVLALLRTARNPTRHPSRRRARTTRHRRHNNNRHNNNNGSSEFYNFGQQLRMNGSDLGFDSWGIMGNDDWDQSAQSIGTYDLLEIGDFRDSAEENGTRRLELGTLYESGLTEQQAVNNDEGDEDDADTFWSIESALNPSPPTESLELDQQNEIETLPTPPETLPTPPETLPTPPETLPTPPETLPTPPETLPTPPETLPTPPETLPTPPETLPTPPETLPTSPETLPTPPETLPTSPLAHVATAHSSIDHKRKRLPISPKHVVKLRGSAVVIRVGCRKNSSS